MFRFSQRTRGGLAYPTVLGFLGLEFNRHDATSDTPTAQRVKEDMRLEAPHLSGWDAIKRMYTKQEPDGLSLELLSCVQLGLGSSVVGFILGGIESTKFTVREYKEANQATIYTNTFEAQRSIQDKVAKAFFKGGLKMAFKCSSFIFCFSVLSTTVSVYRGKTSVTDFTLAGACTGAVFTINRGLLGSISGGVVGGTLGTLTGIAMVTALWAAGIDVQEVRHWQYRQYEKRVQMQHDQYLAERENERKPDERIAFLAITPEEREAKVRIIDKLDSVTKNPVKTDVFIPSVPPESMFRKDKDK